LCGIVVFAIDTAVVVSLVLACRGASGGSGRMKKWEEVGRRGGGGAMWTDKRQERRKRGEKT
jgi:hypothetical protein